MKSFSRNMVEEFYQDESSDSQHEAFNMKITVSGEISDITMLDAIAARFNTTRTAIVSDLIHNSVLEMYFGLSAKDRAIISESADLETTNVLTKKGITQTTVGYGLPQGEQTDEDMTWRGYNAICMKNDKESEDANS